MANDTQRWIYKVVTFKVGFFGFKPEAIEEEMNKLGRDGWELVVANQGYGQAGPTLFFKRPA